MNSPLFADDPKDKQKTTLPKTEPVKKCQRALKFIKGTESATRKNLFNTKSNDKELSKLHKQV